MDETHAYDVVLVGGGVTGTALLYTLARYTNAQRILLVERRVGVAMVNSRSDNNSQTMHSGEIETNFTLAKALRVRAGADLLAAYIERHAPDVCLRLPKMVIGVGDKETAGLAQRYQTFRPHFPHLRLLGREAIAETEPRVVEGRDAAEPLNALYSDHGYAVDYRRLSESFLAEANRSGRVEAVFDREVLAVTREGNGFRVETSNGCVTAKAVVVAAGLSSLLFAHALGVGKEYALLPVAGSFYRCGKVLNGKVYTVQLPGIPFAAVHGDPCVYDRDQTRFGPTAKPLPLIERDHWSTFLDYLRTGSLTPSGVWAVLRVLMTPTFLPFACRNALYDVPWVGKRVFLASARKIVPTLEAKDLQLDRGAGGLRGQLVDTRTGTFPANSEKLLGEGIIFNMAPSPGASYCLGNAVEDVRRLAGFLGPDFRFDEAAMLSELLPQAPSLVTATL